MKRPYLKKLLDERNDLMERPYLKKLLDQRDDLLAAAQETTDATLRQTITSLIEILDDLANNKALGRTWTTLEGQARKKIGDHARNEDIHRYLSKLLEEMAYTITSIHLKDYFLQVQKLTVLTPKESVDFLIETKKLVEQLWRNIDASVLLQDMTLATGQKNKHMLAMLQHPSGKAYTPLQSNLMLLAHRLQEEADKLSNEPLIQHKVNSDDKLKVLVVRTLALLFYDYFGQPLYGCIAKIASAICQEAIEKDYVIYNLRGINLESLPTLRHTLTVSGLKLKKRV